MPLATAGALDDEERAVLREVAHGRTTAEIGVTLNLDANAVTRHKRVAMAKLGPRSRVDVVRFADEKGWLANGR